MRAHPFPQTRRAPNFLMRWRTIIGRNECVCVLSRKAFEGQTLRRRGGGGFVPPPIKNLRPFIQTQELLDS